MGFSKMNKYVVIKAYNFTILEILRLFHILIVCANPTCTVYQV